MSTEVSLFIRVAPPFEVTVRQLRNAADIALRRASKAQAGDRSEVRRLQEFYTAIEQCALASLWAGQPHVSVARDGFQTDEATRRNTVLSRQLDADTSTPQPVINWLSRGDVVVELNLPHQVGDTPVVGVESRGPSAPAPRWKSNSGAPREAQAQRFSELITQALASGDLADAVIRPSDITNSVLTETLREHAATQPGSKPVEFPVLYRDGSYGPPFPLRALNLVSRIPSDWPTLRFTLLSIRHVEMDALVDGAWLRNARISVAREAGMTDQVAFETSIQQLRLLQSPTVIHLYQTGLETAIIGFYRALIRHLLEHPGSISVVPHYFRGRGGFVEGTPWTTS